MIKKCIKDGLVVDLINLVFFRLIFILILWLIGEIFVGVIDSFIFDDEVFSFGLGWRVVFKYISFGEKMVEI